MSHENQGSHQGRLNFLEEVKQANPQDHKQWTPEEVRDLFELDPWDPEDVKLSNRFYKGIGTVRRKALAEAQRLLIFIDGLYSLARKHGKDAAIVKKMVLRYLKMRDRYEWLVMELLEGSTAQGWLDPEAIRILRRELTHGGPARRSGKGGA